MSTPHHLSTQRLDDLAAQIVAGVEQEAQELALQPFFEGMMDEVERRAPRNRRYTAAEFFLRCPEKFKSVVGYLAEGRGLLWIADRVGCSHHTVAAVREKFPKAVAIEKERLADRCQQAASLLVEKIIEEPEKVPAQSWGLTAAQLIDKASQLRGGPTVTIEHRHSFGHEDFNKLLDALPAEAEVLETRYEAEKTSQIAAAAAGVTPALPASGEPVSPGAQGDTDSVSLVYQSADTHATPPATLDQRNPPPGIGGEGVSREGAGGLDGEGS